MNDEFRFYVFIYYLDPNSRDRDVWIIHCVQPGMDEVMKVPQNLPLNGNVLLKGSS